MPASPKCRSWSSGEGRTSEGLQPVCYFWQPGFDVVGLVLLPRTDVCYVDVGCPTSPFVLNAQETGWERGIQHQLNHICPYLIRSNLVTDSSYSPRFAQRFVSSSYPYFLTSASTHHPFATEKGDLDHAPPPPPPLRPLFSNPTSPNHLHHIPNPSHDPMADHPQECKECVYRALRSWRKGKS